MTHFQFFSRSNVGLGHKLFKTGLLACTAALALPATGGAAWAQSQAAEASPTTTSDIIVTAQRRDQRLEDVPMAITALVPEAMEQRGIRNMQDLSQAVAGVQINYQGSFTYPAVRGISSLTTGIGFENNVGVYIDGFYQPDVTAINADFANLQGVEVLKGPQGALYGRNATGGAILISTKRPSSEMTGKVDFRYGEFNDRSASGFVSGPISNSVRYSLALFGRKSDGYYDSLDANGVKINDKAAPMHTLSARAKVEIDLTQNFMATLGYNFTEFEDMRGGMFTVENNRAFLPAKVGRLYDRRTFATNRYSLTRTRISEPTLKLELSTGIGKLTSYTSQAKRRFIHDFDFDASWADSSFSFGRYQEKTFQQGLDFNIEGIEGLDLVIGASYYNDRTTTNPSNAFAANLQSSSTVTSFHTKAFAAYIDGTWHATDKLSIGFGGRYTHEKRTTDYSATTFDNTVTPRGSTTITILPTQNNTLSFNNFSPRGVLTYELADSTNIYASVSRGFRSGFLQALAVNGAVFLNPIKPETITAYELGFKTVQNQFRFDMSTFYYDYANIQVGLTQPNPLCSTCGPINIIANAKKATVFGIEGQITYTPVESLNINASASYLDAKYKKFAAVTSTGLNATTGRNVSNQVQDWSGQQMARAPKFSATLGIDYTTALAGGQLAISANGKYTASYVPNSPALFGALGPVGKTTTQRYRQGSYATLNGSINWTDPSDTYTVGVWVNNLTNVNYRLSWNGSAFGDYNIWNMPRQFGVRLGAKW